MLIIYGMKQDSVSNKDSTSSSLLRTLEKRLRDGGHSAFRTALAPPDVNNAFPLWLEARKNPLTGRWDILRHIVLDTALAVGEPCSVHSDLSFLEALQHCEQFEQDRAGLSAPKSDLPHFSVAAAAARFETQKEEISLLPALPPAAQESMIAPEMPENPPELRALKKENDRLKKNYTRVRKSAQNLNRSVFQTIALGYKSDAVVVSSPDHALPYATGYLGVAGITKLFLLITGVVNPLLMLLLYPVAGLGGLLGIKIRNKKQIMPDLRQHKAFLKKLEKLPDSSPEKTLCQDFARAAQALYTLGYIATLQEDFSVHGGSKRKREKIEDKAMNLIDALSKDMGWDEDQKAILKNKFKTGALPRPGLFAQNLDELHARLQSDLKKAQNRTFETSDAIAWALKKRALPPPQNP